MMYTPLSESVELYRTDDWPAFVCVSPLPADHKRFDGWPRSHV